MQQNCTLPHTPRPYPLDKIRQLFSHSPPPPPPGPMRCVCISWLPWETLNKQWLIYFHKFYDTHNLQRDVEKQKNIFYPTKYFLHIWFNCKNGLRTKRIPKIFRTWSNRVVQCLDQKPQQFSWSELSRFNVGLIWVELMLDCFWLSRVNLNLTPTSSLKSVIIQEWPSVISICNSRTRLSDQ